MKSAPRLSRRFLCALAGLFALAGPALPQRGDDALLTEIEVPDTELNDLRLTPPPLAPSREAEPERFRAFFNPFRTEHVALSPDGRHYAFTLREGAALHVLTVAVDAPTEALAKFLVGTSQRSTPHAQIQSRELVRAEALWMEWVTNDRLVVQTNQAFATARTGGNWHHSSGVVIAVGLDGSEGTTLLTPSDVGRAAEAIGVHGRESSRAPLPADAPSFIEDPVVSAASSNELLAEPEREFEGNLPGFSEIVPRSLTVVDLSPDDPEEIWVRGGPPVDFDLFAVNVRTGRTRMLATERVEPGRGVLLDRQQKAAIALPQLSSIEFPHRYLYDKPGTFFRWRELDRIPADGPLDFFVSPENVLSGRSIPLGFDEDPDLLYFASDIESPTFGIYCLQLSTGKLTDLAAAHPRFDLIPPVLQDFEAGRQLVYDRYSRRLLGIRYDGHQRTTVWLRADWQQLQERLEEAYPGKNVEIRAWDEGARRFLLSLSAPNDPGGFQILDLPTSRSIEVARRAPALDGRARPILLPFSFPLEPATPEQPELRLHGRIWLPTRPVAGPPVPAVVLCPRQPWARLDLEYDRDAAALSAMGYIVIQFNGRGAWGFGRRQREAIRDGFDTAQAADIVQMLDHLAARFALDPKKVAIVGEDLGGYLALRTLQLYGNRFRCAVAINAPLELNRWIEEANWNWSNSAASPLDDRRRLDAQRTAANLRLITAWLGDADYRREAPLLRKAETVMRPVQLFASRRYDGTDESPDYNNVLSVARAIRGRGTTVELHDLHRDFLRGLPEARASVFSRIEGFLYDHMFTYSVDIGELEFVEDGKNASD
jgi:dipeptidyl aminopeptidase/acylaminoacyl peptidase